MKSDDEIKKGLECCHQPVCPKNCPYNKPDGICEMTDDVEIYIPQLEAQNAEQAERIRVLEEERDAAVEDIKRMVQDPYEPAYCEYCKKTEEECAKTNCWHRDQFEWRGVQKEDGNA